MFAVSRSTTYHYDAPAYDTNPYLWESDKSYMNFTFSDFGYMAYWYADTGVSSAFQGYYPRDGSGWIEPRPETGNEMFISFYNGHATYECPLYCEKSGTFSKTILGIPHKDNFEISFWCLQFPPKNERKHST